MNVVIGKSQENVPFGEVWRYGTGWTQYPFHAELYPEGNLAVQFVEALKKNGEKAYTEPHNVMLKRVCQIGVDLSIEQGVA